MPMSRGTTFALDFPTTRGAFQPAFGGGFGDAFVTQLNLSGTALVYSTYLGGTGSDTASGIAVDRSGHAFVTGGAGANFPTTPGAFQPVLAGGSGDAFVTKLNWRGTALIYSTYLGGSSSEGGWGIAVDADGHAYVTGITDSVDFPTTRRAFQSAFGNFSAFVATIGHDEDDHGNDKDSQLPPPATKKRLRGGSHRSRG